MNGIIAPIPDPQETLICREELSGVHDSRPLGPRSPCLPCHNGGMALAHHGAASQGGCRQREPRSASWPRRGSQEAPVCSGKGLGSANAYRVRPYSPVTDPSMASSKPSG
jgi:hypothetical protein